MTQSLASVAGRVEMRQPTPKLGRRVLVHVLPDVAGALGILDLGRRVGKARALVVRDRELRAPVAVAQEGPEAAGVRIARDEVHAGPGVAGEPRAPGAALLLDDEGALPGADEDARCHVSTSAQRLKNVDLVARGDRIGEAAAVADELLAHEDVDVRPQAAALVADVEPDARREGLEAPHHLADRGGLDRDLPPLELRGRSCRGDGSGARWPWPHPSHGAGGACKSELRWAVEARAPLRHSAAPCRTRRHSAPVKPSRGQSPRGPRPGSRSRRRALPAGSPGAPGRRSEARSSSTRAAHALVSAGVHDSVNPMPNCASSEPASSHPPLNVSSARSCRLNR